jgi:excisionase family DNA binding protein
MNVDRNNLIQNNMGNLLYSHDRNDLINAVRIVLDEIRKNDLSANSLPSGDDEKLNQSEVAKLLNVSVQTIIAWRKANKLPHYRIGRFILFDKKEILKIARKAA